MLKLRKNLHGLWHRTLRAFTIHAHCTGTVKVHLHLLDFCPTSGILNRTLNFTISACFCSQVKKLQSTYLTGFITNSHSLPFVQFHMRWWTHFSNPHYHNLQSGYNVVATHWAVSKLISWFQHQFDWFILPPVNSTARFQSINELKFILDNVL
jgi:hypothetical protein